MVMYEHVFASACNLGTDKPVFRCVADACAKMIRNIADALMTPPLANYRVLIAVAPVLILCLVMAVCLWRVK